MFRDLVKLIVVLVFMVGNILAEEFKVGKPFVQLGHTKTINSVAISPNGKYALSGSSDKTLKYWDLRSGKLIYTLKGHNGIINSVVISSDGRYALSGSADKTLKYWDLETGSLVHTFTSAVQNSISSVSISLDGKFALSGEKNNCFASNENFIKYWNLKTGKLIRTLKGHSKDVSSVSISSDGKYALSGSSDKTLKYWDLKTGKVIYTLKGHNLNIVSVLISSDGKYAFSESVPIFENIKGTVKCWNLETGKVVYTLKNENNNIHLIGISKDLKYILTSYKNNTTIRYWDLQTGKLIKTLNSKIHFIGNPIISSDEHYALSQYINEIKYWDLTTGNLINTLGGKNDIVQAVSISRDGEYALLGNEYWNLKKGCLVTTLKGLHGYIKSVSISQDGKYALTGGNDKVLKYWNLKTGEMINTFKGHNNYINTVVILNDGLYALSRSDDKVIKYWDLKNQKLIETIKDNISTWSDIVVINPDGKHVLIKTPFDNSISYLDLKTGKLIFKLHGHKEKINALAITPDGKYAISSSYDNTIKFWNLETGKNTKTIKFFTKNIYSLAISQNLKYILVLSIDGTVTYFNLKTGKEILKMVSFIDGEWLSITPDGYFNASKNGAKHLNILTGPMQVSSIDQYYEQFYRPDIVASVISGKVDKYAKPKLKLSDVKPAPQVEIVDTKKSIKKESLKVTLKITPSSGGIGQVRLYVDGVLIKTDGDRGLQKKKSKNSILKSFSIKLAKGKHIIKAIVYNEANTMASREDTLHVESTYAQITKPNIYAVIIGINKYKNPSISLKYAVADAELFAKTIKARTKDLYGSVHVELLTSKDKTSKKYISKTLKNLEDISPNDLFIFFVASHGMIEDAKYHMITSNVGALSSRKIKQEAISQNSLRDMIANIPTTKKFIVLDTCNSGALGQTLEVALLTRGLTETTAMKVLSRAVGSTIISASSSSQEALEGYKGHGLLTYVLSNGLNGKADSDRDGYIKTLEIANYVEDTVPQIAEEEFNRAQYPYVSPLGQGFPLVKTK